MAVTRQERHTRQHPCKICGGYDEMPRGQGKRCSGFTKGWYCHCSREELAGSLQQDNAQTYAHYLVGQCDCGDTHGPSFNAQSDIEATYDYLDDTKALIFQVVRKAGKKFLQRRPDGTGGWYWNMDGVKRVIYRLPEILKADTAHTVYVVEGEKDANTLAAKGLLSTTSPGGAKKWSMVADVARDALAGRNVVIIADADEVGREHALQVYASLQDVAHSVQILECPEPHKDVTDLFNAGGTLDQLISRFAVAAPEVPPDPWDKHVRRVGKEWYQVAPPPRTWLLRDPRKPDNPGVLPMGKVGQLIAEGGAGKTMILVQLAISVATGTKWLDTLSINTPGRVLLVLGEEDEEEARRRLYRACRYNRGPYPTDGSIVTVSLAGVPCSMIESDAKGNTSDSEFLHWLRAKTVGANIKLIVVDPLSRFAGKDAETDNAAGTRFIQALESIAAVSGATVLVAHHTNKVSRNGATKEIAASAGRGSTSLVDGVRWQAALAVESVVLGEETREVVTLAFTKSNYSRKADSILLKHGDEGVLLPEANVAEVHAAKDVDGQKRQKKAEEQERRVAEAKRREASEAQEKEAKRLQEREARIRTAALAVAKAVQMSPGIGSTDLRGKAASLVPGGLGKDWVTVGTQRCLLSGLIREDRTNARVMSYFPLSSKQFTDTDVIVQSCAEVPSPPHTPPVSGGEPATTRGCGLPPEPEVLAEDSSQNFTRENKSKVMADGEFWPESDSSQNFYSEPELSGPWDDEANGSYGNGHQEPSGEPGSPPTSEPTTDVAPTRPAVTQAVAGHVSGQADNATQPTPGDDKDELL
jgi:RecA-family ATPase